jgi:hypothetical protein
MNDDQLFDNYPVMFITWQRSEKLEINLESLSVGYKKQRVPCNCLLSYMFPHKVKNRVLISKQISTSDQ